jgi:hypothetical protein
MKLNTKILIGVALLGWGLAISLFFGRFTVNIITNQAQTSTQSTIQATVNNNYLTESIVKSINTNYNLTSQTNFNNKSMSLIKDILF